MLSVIAVHLARCAERGVPIVVDPVIISTAGSTITRDVDLDAIARYLLPWATVVTPNREEARLLAGPGGSPRGGGGRTDRPAGRVDRRDHAGAG